MSRTDVEREPKRHGTVADYILIAAGVLCIAGAMVLRYNEKATQQAPATPGTASPQTAADQRHAECSRCPSQPPSTNPATAVPATSASSVESRAPVTAGSGAALASPPPPKSGAPASVAKGSGGAGSQEKLKEACEYWLGKQQRRCYAKTLIKDWEGSLQKCKDSFLTVTGAIFDSKDAKHTKTLGQCLDGYKGSRGDWLDKDPRTMLPTIAKMSKGLVNEKGTCDSAIKAYCKTLDMK